MPIEGHYTLQEASKMGYGNVPALQQQVMRKTLKAVKVGTVWVVKKQDLDEMVARREKWANYWKK